MTETELNALLAGITPANEAARAAAHAHWASLAKPLGGLGRLETMLEDAAALTGSAELDLSRRVVVVLCADNGVVAQGVSQTGQEVTRAVAENLAIRRTSVCQMARTAHCDVLPVDKLQVLLISTVEKSTAIQPYCDITYSIVRHGDANAIAPFYRLTAPQPAPEKETEP